MNTTAQTYTISLHEGFFARRNTVDWIFAVFAVAAGGYALATYAAHMDIYEKAILALSVPAAIWLGWFWRPLRALIAGVAIVSVLAAMAYQGDLQRAESVFWLKYFLSSQSAILWMSLLFFMSTAFYWVGMLATRAVGFDRLGTGFAWAAVTMALVGTMVRWVESHLMGPDIGHIPVSNLYEVFVLFSWMTAAFYLYFEDRYQTRALGAFAMLIVSAAVGFLLWYTLAREQHEIQPLVPALQSWWMKVHVPANFVGYGTFALAAMVAFAYLIKQQAGETKWYKLAPLWLLGTALCLEPLVFRRGAEARIVLVRLLRRVVSHRRRHPAGAAAHCIAASCARCAR